MVNEAVLTAMIKAVDEIRGTLEAKMAETAQPMLPDIGPMYGDISISDRIVPLPFTTEQIKASIDRIDAAIIYETRMNSVVTNATKALMMIRELLPVIAGV